MPQESRRALVFRQAFDKAAFGSRKYGPGYGSLGLQRFEIDADRRARHGEPRYRPSSRDRHEHPAAGRTHPGHPLPVIADHHGLGVQLESLPHEVPQGGAAREKQSPCFPGPPARVVEIGRGRSEPRPLYRVDVTEPRRGSGWTVAQAAGPVGDSRHTLPVGRHSSRSLMRARSASRTPR